MGKKGRYCPDCKGSEPFKQKKGEDSLENSGKRPKGGRGGKKKWDALKRVFLSLERLSVRGEKPLKPLYKCGKGRGEIKQTEEEEI